jgi:CRP-like cAMP-binding protein
LAIAFPDRSTAFLIFPQRSWAAAVYPTFGLQAEFCKKGECVMARKQGPSFDVRSFLAKAVRNESSKQYRERQKVFSQGDPADEIFFLEAGKVQVAVRSKQKKRP